MRRKLIGSNEQCEVDLNQVIGSLLMFGETTCKCGSRSVVNHMSDETDVQTSIGFIFGLFAQEL